MLQRFLFHELNPPPAPKADPKPAAKKRRRVAKLKKRRAKLQENRRGPRRRLLPMIGQMSLSFRLSRRKRPRNDFWLAPDVPPEQVSPEQDARNQEEIYSRAAAIRAGWKDFKDKQNHNRQQPVTLQPVSMTTILGDQMHHCE